MTIETGNKETVRLMRVQTLLLAGIFLIVLAVGIFAAVEFSAVHRSLALIEADLQDIQMEKINDAVESLTKAADQLAEVDVDTFNETAASLRDAANKLSELDTEKINDAVVALTEAANNLSELDTEQLNALISSLEDTASKLQNAVNGITGLFGR